MRWAPQEHFLLRKKPGTSHLKQPADPERVTIAEVFGNADKSNPSFVASILSLHPFSKSPVQALSVKANSRTITLKQFRIVVHDCPLHTPRREADCDPCGPQQRRPPPAAIPPRRRPAGSRS